MSRSTFVYPIRRALSVRGIRVLFAAGAFVAVALVSPPTTPAPAGPTPEGPSADTVTPEKRPSTRSW